MANIIATLPTPDKAKLAYLEVRMSPYKVTLGGNEILIESDDTTVSSLTSWFLVNFGSCWIRTIS